MAKLILVIDTDKNVRHLFKFALEHSKYTLETASTVNDGVSKANIYKPDIIFLNQKILGMYIIATLNRFDIVIPKMPPLYILCNNEKDYEQQIQEAKNKGFDCKVCLKPLDSKQIRSIVNNVFQTNKSLQPI